MLTEQDLKDALADAVQAPEAERLTLGLSDRALAQARAGSWWRRSLSGERRRLMPGIAVGSALVVAAAVGMTAAGGGSGSGNGSPSSFVAPDMPGNPLGQSALTEFGVQCPGGHGPKLDHWYVWDRATQRYVGVPGDWATTFQAAPDGKRALVQHELPGMARSWAVAGWPEAIAGHARQHPIANGNVVQWTADGKEVVSRVREGFGQSGADGVGNKSADFFDPASGRLLASVPIPQQVRAMTTSGQWSLQQWQGDHDSVLFPLLNAQGDRMEFLNARGDIVRTLTLQDGLPADVKLQPMDVETAEISPDGRYLLELSAVHLVTFDLDSGKRIGALDDPKFTFQGWTGAHDIMTAADTATATARNGYQRPLTGHSQVYSVWTPELKVLQQATFVLPADPQGACSTWPMSWAPKSQFPGAFVP